MGVRESKTKQARLDAFHKWIGRNIKGNVFGIYYKEFQHDSAHEKLLIEAYRNYLFSIGFENPEHLRKEER
jgi:hypothetical protein